MNEEYEILKKIINRDKKLPKIYYAFEGNGNAWDNYMEQRKQFKEELKEIERKRKEKEQKKKEQEQMEKEKEKLVKEIAEEIAAEIEKILK